jgi:hypothetical protein
MKFGRHLFVLIIFYLLRYSPVFAQFAYRGTLSSPYIPGWPFGITADSQGKIYLADTQNNMVQVFNVDNSFAFKFGTSGSGNGQFNGIYAIAIDETNGFIYVSDRLNYRVQKFTMNGTFVSIIGGFDSTGNTNGKFYATSGIALDNQGNLYVCDQRKIQKFDNQGNFVATIITLDQPGDLEIDQNGNLFVSQWSEKRILKTSPTGTVLQTYTSGNEYPEGLDLDVNGQVFATYYIPGGASKYTVRKFTNNLEYMTQYGKAGTALGEFANEALDVAIKANGFVYVSEDKRVQFFELESLLITASEYDPKTKTLRLYPNPASRSVLITSDSPISSIVLYDITGRRIKNINYSVGENFLDLSQLDNGVYLVRYTLPGNKIEQQELVVNK